MLLVIDNYDSFTYNLVQYCCEIGYPPKVVRNDAMTIEAICALDPTKIIISPGPGTPSNAGISLEIIHHFKEKVPILGVCLGHQSIAQAFGGKISLARNVIHGKTSQIYHKNKSIFQGLPTPFRATRYHSLIADKGSLPDCLEITAWTHTHKNKVDEIMGIAHRQYPIVGVQFHPESILTENGHNLLENFLQNDSLFIS